MVSNKTSASGRSTSVYTQPYAQWEPEASAPWVAAMRRAGMDRFTSVGLPTSKQEDWRFTPLTPFHALPFRPLLVPAAQLPSSERLARVTFGKMEGNRLVFVDGHFAPGLSQVEGLPEGVIVDAVSRRWTGEDGFLSSQMGPGTPVEENAFAALNAAYFTDGACLKVPAGVQVKQPVRVVHLATAAEPGGAAHTRNLVVLGEDSALTVIEAYASLTTQPHLTNSVTQFCVGPSARLEHLRFQDENPAAVHLATLEGQFDRSSQTRLHSFALGARLSRVNLRTHLAGEGLECTLNGLYLTRGEQLADHHMIVEHAAPHCASHEYFNGILDDRSRGVFHGRILVRSEAQRTDAKQTNKNILLSDTAQVDAKPQLEIYADDVKCTHGATVGQLNEESIFYLRSRGLDLETARRMLIHAFAGEIIERVQCEAARIELDRLVWDRLEQNPHIGTDHV